MLYRKVQRARSLRALKGQWKEEDKKREEPASKAQKGGIGALKGQRKEFQLGTELLFRSTGAYV